MDGTLHRDCETEYFEGDVILADILPGETLAVVYEMFARGITERGERGFNGRIGDPFSLPGEGGPGAFLLVVPEPTTAVLLALGLVGLGRREHWRG